jgi:hypothetical protein
MTFTFFWDFDRVNLRKLSFSGRVEWLQLRTHEVVLKPLSLLRDEADEAYVYLAAVELACAGIEGLASFLGKGRNGKKSAFCHFVSSFMHSDFQKEALDHEGKQITYCEHLKRYFRNSLDHSFAIVWGGLWHANDPKWPGGYLRPNINNEGIAICPLHFLDDLDKAVPRYFETLENDGLTSVMGQNFTKRFEGILNQRLGR